MVIADADVGTRRDIPIHEPGIHGIAGIRQGGEGAALFVIDGLRGIRADAPVRAGEGRDCEQRGVTEGIEIAVI